MDTIESTYGERFPHLKHELAVRRFLLTGQAAFGDSASDSLIGGWKEYASNGVPTGKSGASVALTGMSLIRKAHETGKGYKKAVNAVWQMLPIHRQGSLSLGSAIDGSQGLRGMSMLSDLVGATDPQKVASALITVEQARRRNHIRKDYSNGGNIILGMELENRGKLLKATHQARQAIRGYWGGGTEPTSSLDALSTVEQSLSTKKTGDASFQNLKLHNKVDLKSLYKRLNGYAIISYVKLDNELYGLVLPPTEVDAGEPGRASIQKLGDSASVQSIVKQQHDLLIAGSKDRAVFKPHGKSHKVGNALNLKLLGPFSAKSLSGFGRYVVIADDDLLGFSLSVLPDQQDGLRFLQDNRQITSSTGLAEMLRSSPELGSFSPDVYAVTKPDMAELKKDEDDLYDVSQRMMPTNYSVIKMAAFDKSRAVMLAGKKATLSSYAESALTARYLSFSGMKSSPNGGFVMADGDLSISQIAQQPLMATVVFLEYDNDRDMQMRRVRAFLNAGARAVVVGAWELDEKSTRLMMSRIFEKLNREDTIHDLIKTHAKSSKRVF